MTTIRQYNVLRRDYMTRTRQKEAIKDFWKDHFISFLRSEDKRYITFLVRV